MKIRYIIIIILSLFTNLSYASFRDYAWHLIYAGHLAQARTFLSHLRSQGNPEAIHFLGYMVLERVFMAEHPAEDANQLFAEAAAFGYPPSIKALADAYVSGDGVEKNIDLALSLYKRAADLGYGPAQFSAGELLRPSSCHESLYYFSLAARNPDLGPLQEDARLWKKKIEKVCVRGRLIRF